MGKLVKQAVTWTGKSQVQMDIRTFKWTSVVLFNRSYAHNKDLRFLQYNTETLDNYSMVNCGKGCYFRNDLLNWPPHIYLVEYGGVTSEYLSMSASPPSMVML